MSGPGSLVTTPLATVALIIVHHRNKNPCRYEIMHVALEPVWTITPIVITWNRVNSRRIRVNFMEQAVAHLDHDNLSVDVHFAAATCAC